MLSAITNQTSKIERLEARVSAEKKNLFKYAADLSGRTLTDFIISSVYKAAINIIKEHEQINLSLKDRDVFIRALLNPPKPSKNLVAAAKQYKKKVIAK